MNKDYIVVDTTEQRELIEWETLDKSVDSVKYWIQFEREEKMLHDITVGHWTYFNAVLYIVDADKVEEAGDEEGKCLGWEEITDDRHDEFVLEEHSVFMEAVPAVDVTWQ